MIRACSSLIDNTFWIGGSPCAGKSSVCDLLASRYNLGLYQVDFELRGQIDRIDPVRHPALFGWLAASCDQRWLKPVDELVDDVIGCYREHFSLIAEDLLSLHESNRPSGNRQSLVEGSALLPALVARYAVSPLTAVWMVPTPAFQLEHYQRRPWVREMLSDCTDARLAFENWMARDIRFARWAADQAAGRGYTVIWVNGDQDIEQTAIQIASHFGL